MEAFKIFKWEQRKVCVRVCVCVGKRESAICVCMWHVSIITEINSFLPFPLRSVNTPPQHSASETQPRTHVEARRMLCVCAGPWERLGKPSRAIRPCVRTGFSDDLQNSPQCLRLCRGAKRRGEKEMIIGYDLYSAGFEIAGDDVGKLGHNGFIIWGQ